MNLRTTTASVATAFVLLATAGCAVTRGQETTGAYVNDAEITSSIKTHMVENKNVDASAIKVETLNGTVMLSGFAKSSLEKSTADSIARNTKGVREVKNEIAVRP